MARGKPWSRDIWKTLAVGAVAISAVQAAAAVYVVLAFKSNIDVIAKSAPVCYGGMADFDSIAAAQAIGRLDLVSFLLATGGVMLGLFSLIGFWIIRREAMEEARDAALEEVRKVLPRLGINGNGGNPHNRGGPSQQSHAIGRASANEEFPDLPEPDDVSVSGAVPESRGDANDDA